MRQRVLRACLVCACLSATLVAPPTADALTWPARSQALSEGLASENVVERQEAARGIHELEVAEALPLLDVALRDRDPDVLEIAIEAAAILGATEVLPRLRTLLGDRVATVRAAAARALGDLRAPGSLEALARSLSDTDDSVRAAAAAALGRLGRPDAAQLLTDALRDRSTDVAEAAADALAQLAQPGTIYALVESMSASSESVALASIEAVGAMRAQSAAPALMGLAQSDHRPAVRAAALRALGQVGGPEAASALLATLETGTDPLELNAAVDGLRQMADAMPWPALVTLATRQPVLVQPLFEQAPADVWPLLRNAWQSLASAHAERRQSFEMLWLASGDPMGFETWLASDAAQYSDRASLLEMYRSSNSSHAFCRAVDDFSGDETLQMTLADWGLTIGDTSCLETVLARIPDGDFEVPEFSEAGGVLWQPTPLAVDVLADAWSGAAPDWEDATVALEWLGTSDVDAGELLFQLLASDDARLRDDAAFWLAERDPEAWTSAEVQQILTLADRAPQVLRALASLPAARLADVLADSRFDDAEGERRIELLSLCARTGQAPRESWLEGALASGDFWQVRAVWDWRSRSGAELTSLPEAGQDPWLDGLRASASLDPETAVETVRDREAGLDVRVAAIARIDAVPPTDVLDALLADRNTAIVAATLLRLYELDALPDATSLLLRAASAPTSLERSVLYGLSAQMRAAELESEAAAESESDYEATLQRVLAAEQDAAARAVAEGRNISDEGGTTVHAIDPRRGLPGADAPLFVVYADGDWALVRADAEGRWVTPRAVRLVNVVTP